MNILVTSAGRRVKIIEYFKNALKIEKGKVIATDCDINAPALYFADAFEIVPRIDSLNYIDIILQICKKHDIDAILSLIDPELGLLAQNKKRFDENNIKLILSPYELVEMSFDKCKTFEYLSKLGVPTVPTYQNLNEVLELITENKLSFPLVIKPARGSASIGIFIVENEYELKEQFVKNDNQIIQPFFKDKEFGIDVYVDMVSGKLVDIFIKEKIRMRAGETDKSISVNNEKIVKIVEQLISKSGFIGPIDIDCFEYKGEYYLSEINPRFGGGYPHAYEQGCNFMELIVKNLNNEENKPYKNLKYSPGKTMLKFDSIKII